MKKKNFIGMGLIILFLGFGCLPQILLFPVYREGIRVVEMIEKYKAQHGAYPDNLEQLEEKIKYDDKGVCGIRYATHNDGNEFRLVCYSIWTFREVYSSQTKEWVMIK